MKPFMYCIKCCESKDGVEEYYMLEDMPGMMLGCDEKAVIADVAIECSGMIEEEREKAESLGKMFDFEIFVRPF